MCVLTLCSADKKLQAMAGRALLGSVKGLSRTRSLFRPRGLAVGELYLIQINILYSHDIQCIYMYMDWYNCVIIL